MNDDTVTEIASDNSSLAILNSSEINQQIATARRYPRDIRAVLNEAKELATITQNTAKACIYALPRDGKTVEGPSARLAEILVHSWGNVRAGHRVIDDQGDFVTSQGVFHDLEKNVAITCEVKRRITDKTGKRFKPDMIGVTANAASSIAFRNAVLKGIPKAFWSPVYEAARKVVMGDAKTLANRRAEELADLQQLGATEAMVLTLLGVTARNDITSDHLVILSGIATAIRDGDTTVEEAFQEPTRQNLTSQIRRKSKAGSADLPDAETESMLGGKPEISRSESLFADRLLMISEAEERGQLDFIADMSEAEFSPNQRRALAAAIANKRASFPMDDVP